MSGLLEPLRLGEEAPAGHSWENVCRWTTLFEALSPLEACLSCKERETSTNYTFTQVSFSVVFYCVNELLKLVGAGVKDKRDEGRTQGG